MARRAFSRAYPRSRGATRLHGPDQLGVEGLSPLARGNLEKMAVPKLAVGPIPARAGQPCSKSICASSSRAYPRSRGATYSLSDNSAAVGGLSPLARGNLPGDPLNTAPQGPIPARAGQPAWARAYEWGAGAYPRSRGATYSCSPRPVP